MALWQYDHVITSSKLKKKRHFDFAENQQSRKMEQNMKQQVIPADL